MNANDPLRLGRIVHVEPPSHDFDAFNSALTDVSKEFNSAESVGSNNAGRTLGTVICNLSSVISIFTGSHPGMPNPGIASFRCPGASLRQAQRTNCSTLRVWPADSSTIVVSTGRLIGPADLPSGQRDAGEPVIIEQGFLFNSPDRIPGNGNPAAVSTFKCVPAQEREPAL
jgi:hypothetical protein